MHDDNKTEEQRKLNTEKERARRAKQQAAGLCVTCKKPAPGKYKQCAACREGGRQRAAARKQQGLCPRCNHGIPVDGGYCLSCRDKRTARQRRIRLEVLAHYGGKCACCGESEPDFLQFDHINNDGAAHSREVKDPHIANWLRKNGYPDTFQILCSNCNFAKGQYGICPHQRHKEVKDD